MKNYDELWDEYFIPGTNTLKNNLNITDSKELSQKETDITFQKMIELYENPYAGNFDKEHLCGLHKFLFGDIYPWAGEFRKVNTAKGNSMFISEQYIANQLEETLKEMKTKLPLMATKEDYIYELANYYYDLIVIHPFREGNGRTIREFMREFVLEMNKYIPYGPFELDWSKTTKEDLLIATREMFMFKTKMVEEFRKMLIPLEEKETFKRD